MSCSVERFGPARLYRTLRLWSLLRRSVGRRYLALVTDYDGTIASKGRASAAALHAIARLRASGRRSILVTSSNAVVSLSPSIRSLSKMGSPACDCIAAIPDDISCPVAATPENGRQRVNHLPVISDGRLEGVFSRSNVLRLPADSCEIPQGRPHKDR